MPSETVSLPSNDCVDTATAVPKESEKVEVAPQPEESVEDKPVSQQSTNEEKAEVSETKKSNMSEGVEVVLDSSNRSTIVSQDQNVFRAPDPVRPRAMRAQGPPHITSSGSYGYGGPADYGHSPYPYAPSASFEEAQYAPPTSHFSPHVQYPPHSRPEGDVNVISPHHKEHSHRPPTTPRRNGSYQYPPTSPVSRPGGHHSPPRMRGYAMRRPEGPYSVAQRSRSHPPSRHHDDGAWGSYSSPDRQRPPIVAESSFDSEHYPSHTSHASHPTTPSAPHYGAPMHRDGHYPRQGFHGGSFGSFDSPAPGHYDQRGYYGRSPHYPPESPYTPYSHGYPGYSPGGYHDYYSPHYEYGRHPRHYDDDYHHMNSKNGDGSGMMLPKAAQEVDFDVTDPPTEPVLEPSKTPVCESPADVNGYDVLCGRGGGTNSQIGNRRFRKLVQEFQPTYLLARRKEKPLLARTIVLIIRKRGGRFLKKDDETGELYEVGDSKAEAKTSQALREGLDVRATKSAASNLLDKKKKKKASALKDEDTVTSPTSSPEDSPIESPEKSPVPKVERKAPSVPPSLPKLNEDQGPPPAHTSSYRPPSPNSMHFRKRRRVRSGDASDRGIPAGCGGGFRDQLFPDFCPPRADLGRVASPTMHDMAGPMDMSHTPGGHGMRMDDDIYAGSPPPPQRPGCAGIALDIVTGAAGGAFCMGPRKWR